MRSLEQTCVTATVTARDRDYLKLLSEDEGVTMAALIRTAVNEYLERRGLPLLADISLRGRPREEEGVGA